MPNDRIELLRILSNLDQSMAKVERIIESEQTYDGWQAATAVRVKLENAYTRALDALRRTVWYSTSAALVAGFFMRNILWRPKPRSLSLRRTGSRAKAFDGQTRYAGLAVNTKGVSVLRYFVAGNVWLFLAVLAYVGQHSVSDTPASTIFGVGRMLAPYEYDSLLFLLLMMSLICFGLCSRTTKKTNS
jgi:hypothetical protein